MLNNLSNKINFKYINESPSSKLFIFLHGFMGDHNDWQTLDPYIKIPRALYIDIPGHGKSPLSADACWQSVCDQILELIKGFEGEKILVGYSLGGRIALQLLAQSPDTFQLVICESSSFGIQDPLEKQQRKAKDENLFRDVGDAKDFLDFLYKWYDMQLFEGMKNKEDVILKKSKGNFKKYSHAIAVLGVGRQPYLLEKLIALKRKIIYLAGTRDSKYMGLSQKWLEKGGAVKTFSNASHNIHNDQPALYGKFLTHYLDC